MLPNNKVLAHLAGMLRYDINIGFENLFSQFFEPGKLSQSGQGCHIRGSKIGTRVDMAFAQWVCFTQNYRIRHCGEAFTDQGAARAGKVLNQSDWRRGLFFGLEGF